LTVIKAHHLHHCALRRSDTAAAIIPYDMSRGAEYIVIITRGSHRWAEDRAHSRGYA